MADTAAHLVDRVLPRAPVRQWVLSLPLPLRYRAGRGRVASGPRTGQRVLRFGDRVHPDLLPEAAQTSPRCASLAGVSVHANVAVPANDRARLERLCRYVARPPLASERLERGPRNLLVYRLRHRWRDGTTHVLFEPVELLERLAALVPPPRFNLVRYHGVLAPAASQRKTVASHAGGAQTPSVRVHAGCAGPGARAQQGPGAPPPPAGIDPSDSQLPRRPRAEPPAPASDPAGGTAPHDEDRPRRYAWAELMRRVFTVDVLECPRCAGPMRILAAIHPPTATRAILECLDLPSRAPPVAPPVQGTAPDPFTDDFEAAVDPGA